MNTNKINNSHFYKICGLGLIDQAQHILSTTNIDIHASGDLAFRQSCIKGQLAVAQWLIHLGENGYGKIDIHVNEEEAFRCACKKGHLV